MGTIYSHKVYTAWETMWLWLLLRTVAKVTLKSPKTWPIFLWCQLELRSSLLCQLHLTFTNVCKHSYCTWWKNCTGENGNWPLLYSPHKWLYGFVIEGILGEKLLASFMFLFSDIAKFCYSQECLQLILTVTEPEFLHQETPALWILHGFGPVNVMWWGHCLSCTHIAAAQLCLGTQNSHWIHTDHTGWTWLFLSGQEHCKCCNGVIMTNKKNTSP